MKRALILATAMAIAAAGASAQAPGAADADAPRFKLTDTGGLLADGKPLLPIIVWAQPSSLLEYYKGLGVNTMHPGESEEKDPIKAYLDKLQAAGMYALVNLAAYKDEIKSHPAVVAWTVEHEPDMASEPAYEPDLSGEAAIVWIEAESAKTNTLNRSPWLEGSKPALSGKQCVGTQALEGQLTWEFQVKTAGKYNLWVREFTHTWANPTVWSLNGAAEQTTPRVLPVKDNTNLGGGRGVGWSPYGQVELKAGSNTLTFKPGKGRTLGKGDKVDPNAVIWAVDAICFTTADSYPPAKKLEPLPTRLPEVEKANYEKVKKLMPGALTWNILGAGFFGPYQKSYKLPMRYYGEFLKWADITSFDHYPVTGWNKPDRLPEVGLATRKLVSLARKGQPVWTIIEASDQDLSWTAKETRGPNAAEMRAEAYMAIANGAKGLGYFTIAFEPFRWKNLTPEVEAEMKRTNGELTELAGPIVLGDTAKKLTISGDETKDAAAAGHAIQAIRKEYQGKTYVIAVNVTREAAKPTFTLADPPAGAKAAVWKTDRTVEIKDGAFTDELAPLAVRVYVVE